METSSSGSPALEALDGENPNRRAVLAAFGVALVGVLIGAALGDVIAGRADEAPAAEGGDSLFLADQELGWANRPDWSRGVRHRHQLTRPARPGPARRTPRSTTCAASRGSSSAARRTCSAWAPGGAGLARPPAVRVRGGDRARAALHQRRRPGYCWSRSAARHAARGAPRTGRDRPGGLPGRQALLDSSPAAKWTRVGDEIVPTDVIEGWPTALRAIPARAIAR